MTLVGSNLSCSVCGAVPTGPSKFCTSCGAPLDPQVHDDPPSRPTVPGELLLVCVLMAATGLAVLAVVALFLKDIWPPPGWSSPSLERSLYALESVTAVILATMGLGLLAVTGMCARGRREGRALAVLVLGIVAISLIFTPFRDAGTWTALALALGCIAVLLGSPRCHAFFAAADRRPTGVVVATTVIAYFIWDFALLGLILLAGATSGFAGRSQTGHGVEGSLLVLGSLTLLVANSWLRRGNRIALGVTALALVVVGVVAVVAVRHGLGAYLLPLLAAGALAGLFIPQSSHEFFAGTSDRVVAGAGRFVGPALGGAVVLALIGYIFVPATGRHAVPAAAVVPSSSSVDPSADTGSTGASGSAQTVAAGPTVRTWTATASAAGGYRETITISVGAPQHYAADLSNDGADLSASGSCTGDPTTDAVVPVEIQETNTSSGFAAPTAATLSWADSDSDESLSFDGDYGGTTGTTCMTDGTAGLTVSSLQPSGTEDLPGFFVLSGYYTPDNPDGDADHLASTLFTVTGGTTGSDAGDSGSSGTGPDLDYSVSALSGPGAGEADGSWELDLAGAPVITSDGTSGASGDSSTSGSGPPDTASGNSGAVGSGNSGSDATSGSSGSGEESTTTTDSSSGTSGNSGQASSSGTSGSAGASGTS